MGTVTSAREQLFGTDVAFPMRVDGQGRIALVGGQDNLKQAVIAWLETNVGEMIYARDKGVGLRKYVHMLTSHVKKIAPIEIETGLMKFEKRLEWVKVTVTEDVPGRSCYLTIRYKPIGYAIEGLVTVPIIVSEKK